MTPGERISLLIMRDNGASRRIRMRRSLFVSLVALCLLMPFAVAGSTWFGAALWLRHEDLGQRYHKLERQYQEALATATRLASLETLLQRRNAAEQAVLAQNIASPAQKSVAGAAAPAANAPSTNAPAANVADGPGHDEFPGTSTGFLTIDNVNARLLQGNRLRVTLNLRNPDPRRTINGSVSCTLATADGQTVPLRFQPADAGDFRISRLKKAVLMAALPAGVTAANAQVIVEAKNDKGELVYRNVFPVAR